MGLEPELEEKPLTSLIPFVVLGTECRAPCMLGQSLSRSYTTFHVYNLKAWKFTVRKVLV